MLTLLAFVFVVGTLVLIHELGHFLVARFFGVRVTTFAIGFPPTVFRRKIGDTEYTVGLLPIGGYVRMAGEAPGQGSDDPGDLQNHPRSERLAILFAGPAMNLVLAVLLLGGLFYFGMERRIGLADPPVVTYLAADTPAAAAGVEVGDRIVSIAGDEVDDWRGAIERIIVLGGRTAAFEVERDGRMLSLPVDVEARGKEEIGYAGIFPPAPPRLGEVEPGMPADRAGLRPGDLVTAIDGRPVGSTNEVAERVVASGGEPLSLSVDRDGAEVAVTVAPEWTDDPEVDARTPRIGVRFAPPFRRVQADSVGGALGEAVAETARWGALTIRHISGMVMGAVSPRQLSGPIGIAQASGEAIRRGPRDVILLMALLSLSLGVLNLLPIPVLDGGQIAVLLVESVARRDLSLRVRQGLMLFGAALMVAVFIFVIALDLSKSGVFERMFG